MDPANTNSRGLQQKPDAARRESKKIIWPLMFFPHMWNDQMDHSARLQHSLKFFNDSRGLWRMFQNDDRKHVIEGRIWKWQLLEPRNRVEPGIIPLRIPLCEIDGNIFRMGEERFESAFPCS